jgi:S-methylmethionine-dependent homocysteine/selenocysteine methylase
MNQFVQRVANYIANVSVLFHGELKRCILILNCCNQSHQQEIFIKGLANSKTFQRFAVHTDRHIQKIKKEGVETLNSHMDEFHKQATKAAYSTSTKEGASAAGGGGNMVPPTKPMEGVAGFFSALGKVIRRDLGMRK